MAVDGEGLEPESLRAALRSGVRAVVCSPRGQCPTGAFFTRSRRDELVAVLRDFPEVLVVEDDHNADIGGAPAHTLAAAGLDRWAQVRTVSKHLGIDLRWAGVACDGITLGRHDGRMLMTSGWVSHVLQETVVGLLRDSAVRALVADGEAAYAERRAALIDALRAYRIRAVGASGLNVWVPVRDESAVVNGLRTQGWWVAARACSESTMPSAEGEGEHSDPNDHSEPGHPGPLGHRSPGELWVPERECGIAAPAGLV
ncbi:hypothetical protein ACWCQ0_49885, partial [Streptomyces massasporeus]